MKTYTHTLNDFGYLYIENLYTKNELTDIKNEICFLDSVMEDKAQQLERRNHGSIAKDGTHQMTGTGVYVDGMYVNREHSSILKHNRKIVDSKIINEFTKTHASSIQYLMCNQDFTVLNKYKNNAEYTPHVDLCSFTAITMLQTNEHKIKGGDLIFADYKIVFPFLNNSCVIFPSWVKHACTPVKSKKAIRYSIAQFFHISPSARAEK